MFRQKMGCFVIVACLSLSSACGGPANKRPTLCHSVASCVATIRVAIGKNWHNPYPNTALRTRLLLKLDSDGRVKKLSVVDSSGDKAFDASVIRAVDQAAPFGQIAGLSETDVQQFNELALTFVSPTARQ